MPGTLQPLVPELDYNVMFQFPYKDLGLRIDHAGSSLPIFGHQLFAFTEPNAHLETYYSLWQGKSFRKAKLNQQCYTTLKGSSDNNKEFLSTEHLALTSEWFWGNSNSKVTEMFDVVWSDFIRILNDFYNSMINMKECFEDERAVWNIHPFLMDRLNLLNN